MDLFLQLFGRFVALVYHCFDRVVIQGYLPLLTREEHIVHFFLRSKSSRSYDHTDEKSS